MGGVARTLAEPLYFAAALLDLQIDLVRHVEFPIESCLNQPRV